MKSELQQIPPLTSYNIQDYKKTLNSLDPRDLADLLESRKYSERILIFLTISPKQAVSAFEYLSFPSQKEILNGLPPQVATSILNELSPDDRTRFMEDLPLPVLDKLLKFLSASERTLTEKLLSYPENSIGRIMTTDFISIKMDWTVRQVFEFLREYGRDSETISYLYVVDENGVLIDDISIRECIFASLDAKISDISDRRFIALNVNESQEKAVNVFRRYDRSALPVTDDSGKLLGLVTIDDILHVADQESTEDIQKIGGSEALDMPYMVTPFLEIIKKRASWLVVLFFGEMLTASAMAVYEDEISKAVVLALFLPLIISSGGNSGSQASTLIIRAMALGEVSLKDYWRVMKREIFAGLFLGIILGTIGFFRVSLWSAFSNMYGEYWFMVAVTIYLALIGVVMWGSLVGAMLPFILRKCGVDPATSSAPFVATIVDVTGLMIYFTIAMFTLKGTLL